MKALLHRALLVLLTLAAATSEAPVNANPEGDVRQSAHNYTISRRAPPRKVCRTPSPGQEECHWETELPEHMWLDELTNANAPVVPPPVVPPPVVPPADIAPVSSSDALMAGELLKILPSGLYVDQRTCGADEVNLAKESIAGVAKLARAGLIALDAALVGRPNNPAAYFFGPDPGNVAVQVVLNRALAYSSGMRIPNTPIRISCQDKEGRCPLGVLAYSLEESHSIILCRSFFTDLHPNGQPCQGDITTTGRTGLGANTRAAVLLHHFTRVISGGLITGLCYGTFQCHHLMLDEGANSLRYHTNADSIARFASWAYDLGFATMSSLQDPVYPCLHRFRPELDEQSRPQPYEPKSRERKTTTWTPLLPEMAQDPTRPHLAALPASPAPPASPALPESPALPISPAGSLHPTRPRTRPGPKAGSFTGTWSPRLDAPDGPLGGPPADQGTKAKGTGPPNGITKTKAKPKPKRPRPEGLAARDGLIARSPADDECSTSAAGSRCTADTAASTETLTDASTDAQMVNQLMQWGLYVDTGTCAGDRFQTADQAIQSMGSLAQAGLVALSLPQISKPGNPAAYFSDTNSQKRLESALNLAGMFAGAIPWSTEASLPIRISCRDEKSWCSSGVATYGDAGSRSVILCDPFFARLNFNNAPCTGEATTDGRSGLGANTRGAALLRECIHVNSDPLSDWCMAGETCDEPHDGEASIFYPSAAGYARFASWAWDLGFGALQTVGEPCLERFRPALKRPPVQELANPRSRPRPRLRPSFVQPKALGVGTDRGPGFQP